MARDSIWSDSGGVLHSGEFTSEATTRGFTGHEHLDQHRLIHMNGRVYDPALGRFLSVDPWVTDKTNSQSFNAYSYVMNNPLSGTDPTGYKKSSTGTEETPGLVPVTAAEADPAPSTNAGNGADTTAERVQNSAPSNLGKNAATFFFKATDFMTGLMEGTVPLLYPGPGYAMNGHDGAYALGLVIGGVGGVVLSAFGTEAGVGIGVSGAGAGGVGVVATAPAGAAIAVASGANGLMATAEIARGTGALVNELMKEGDEVQAPQAGQTPAGGDGEPRFVGQPDGQVVDTHATPRGSYRQPDGSRTDILQLGDHGDGFSHTHESILNINSEGKYFINGTKQEARKVLAEEIANIVSGAASRLKPKGR